MVPVMVEQKPEDSEFWLKLAKCASSFLFFCGSGEWMSNKAWKDEKVDIKMVMLLKSLVFRDDLNLPNLFLVEVVKMFHRGSCINDYGNSSSILVNISTQLIQLISFPRRYQCLRKGRICAILFLLTSRVCSQGSYQRV